MPEKMPKLDSSTRLNTLEPRMAKASIAINSEGNLPESISELDGVSLFFAALADVGMSDKEAAYTMAMDPAQLSRVKTKQARLPFDAMWRLPASFWLALRARIDHAKQLTADADRGLKAARIGELVKLLVEVAS